jgi:hypothetical protein
MPKGVLLANAINEAALLAVRKKRSAVGMVEMDEAVDRIIGGLEKKNRVINLKEIKIVAYHEVGHAIVIRSLYVLELTKCAFQDETIRFSFFTLPGKLEEARSGVAKGS